MRKMQVYSESTGQEDVLIESEPHVCPHCHRSITPQVFQGFRRAQILEVVFRCPDKNCRKIFVGYYNHEVVNKNWTFVFKNTSSGAAKTRDFSENIHKVSPSFVVIYNQATSADAYGLDEIVGVGLRKALEFLIKDYICMRNLDKADEVRKKFLSACINDNIENQNIKDMAKRAAWLGNDETHYVRRWEEKDIRDLKRLMDITLHWIEMEMLTEKYKSDMGEGI